MGNMKKCKNSKDHAWLYEHTVWEGPQANQPDCLGVMRQCNRCGKKQMGFVRKWGNPPRKYQLPDIRGES